MSLKKDIQKNQIIITALAVTIAVAGYINYSDSRLKTQSAKSSDNSEKQRRQPISEISRRRSKVLIMI